MKNIFKKKIKTFFLFLLRKLFCIKNKKILICTVPKSGSHLMKRYVQFYYFRIAIGLGENRKKDPITNRREKLTLKYITNIEKKEGCGLILWGHLFNADKEIIKHIKKNYTVIIITRNPKEIVCSYLRTILKEKKHHYHRYITNLSNEDRINKLIKNFPAADSKSLFFLIKLQNKFINLKNFHYFKFEDLVLLNNQKRSLNFWESIYKLEKCLNITGPSKYLSRLLIILYGYNNKGSNFKHKKMFTPMNEIFHNKIQNNEKE